VEGKQDPDEREEHAEQTKVDLRLGDEVPDRAARRSRCLPGRGRGDVSHARPPQAA
jgi:hypothetical protein